MSKAKNRYAEAAIHILVLAYIFTAPLFTTRSGDSITWQRYVSFIAVPTALCTMFYINYFVLIPRYFMQHRNRAYYVANVLIIIVSVLLLSAFMHYVVPLLLDNAGGFADGHNFPHHQAPQPPGKHGAHLPPPPPHHHGPHPGKHIFVGPLAIRDTFSLICAAAAALAMRLSIYWQQKETERQKTKLEQTHAALLNLKTQTSPHFLLNTLNNIYSLTAFDTEKAQHAILELSKMLRYQLYESDAETVPLTREAEFLINYIELMRLRLADHVSVTTDIQLPPSDDILIAPHILISLVENAFKHGVSAEHPSFIQISLKAESGNIHFLCRNSNFPSSASADGTQSGIGLRQVESRLSLIYDGRYHWQRGPSPDGKVYTSEIHITL